MNITFEEAMEKLQEAAEKLRNENIPLDEALKCYEEGKKYYELCEKKLTEAKQKIETFKDNEISG
ncbi:MAG: exodeoxyribonuclease VII small subunit [Anaerovoracaceae bacterium]